MWVMIRVIHYTRTQPRMMERDSNLRCGNCGYELRMRRGVVKTCLDCFLKGHRLFRCEYQISALHFMFKRSGTCSTGSYDPPDVVIGRANDTLKGNQFGKYDLFDNNCESFAFYCKTGNRTSPQVFSIKSAAKIALDAVVKHKLERLQHDILVHQKEKTKVEFLWR